MNKYGLLACLLLMLHIAAWGQNGRNEKRKKTECKMVKIKAERLPDLNIPRSAHALFCVGGEITVVGGHTESFVPTPTAEYFKDGAWHLVSTKYSHDNGLSVVLQSGKVVEFTPTAIDAVEYNGNKLSHLTSHPSSSLWYTIDGRQLSGEPSSAGIYLHDGRAVVKK